MLAAVGLDMQPNTEKRSRRAPSTDLRRLLREDHERLERLFAELLAAFQADARPQAASLWTDFDAALQAHLLLEEQYILPEFAKRDAAEAAALTEEHDRIRQRLLELGVGVDLHLTNDDQVEAFLRGLRQHAAREDALMYRWAQRALHPEARSSVLHWLGAKRKPAR